MTDATVSTAQGRGSSAIFLALIAILSVAGMVVSGISLQRHYAKSETGFCDISQKLNCDIVNRSEYSKIMGIPVAGIGLAGYAALFWLATFWKSRPETPTRLLIAAVAGFLFALRLTYLEGFELGTWCIFCVVSQICIFLIALLAIPVKLRSATD